MVNGSNLGLVCGLWFVVWFVIFRWVWSQRLSLVHGLVQTWWLLVVDGSGCLRLLWLVGAILGVWQWYLGGWQWFLGVVCYCWVVVVVVVDLILMCFGGCC